MKPQWNWNWNPDRKKTILIDLETQSAENLKLVGSNAYLTHPTTRLMSLVAMNLDVRVILIWVPEGVAPAKLSELFESEFWPDDFPNREAYTLFFTTSADVPETLTNWIRNGYTFVAHNATGFDAQAWYCLVDQTEPVTWFDTMPCAKAGGYPGDLDSLGKLLMGRGKDAGESALKLLYTAKRSRSGEIVYNVGTVPLWQMMLRYNVGDVLLLESVFNTVEPYGEADVLAVHQSVNERGIAFDRDFLTAFHTLWIEAEQKAGDELTVVTNGKLTINDARSPVKVKKYLLKECGIILDSLARDEMERLYNDPENFFGDCDIEDMRIEHAVEVLKLRQAANRTGKGKLDKMFQLSDSDDRIRNLLVYYGAHTGRFSGRGLQPHNFARGRAEIDVEHLFECFRKVRSRLPTWNSKRFR
jgi:DNA polymerase